MEYTYKTRQELSNAYLENWKKEKIQLFQSDEIKTLITEVLSLATEKRRNCAKINEILKENTDITSLSGFMKNNYKFLVDAFVPKEYQQDYYYIVDKFNQFQYAQGMNRRSVRTASYGPYIRMAFELLASYMAFGIYQCSIDDYLRNNLTPELRDYKYNGIYPSNLYVARFDDMLAARIDLGDKVILDTITESFTSETNYIAVTTDNIRAVVKSSNSTLHKLLCKFLVAARLSEGLRQAICENADCGTAEAFIAILHTIDEENLLRFSAVKRAVATWTGIYREEHVDRMSNKMAADMIPALENRDFARSLIWTEDTVHIMIGLWALGFYEVRDAISEMNQILERGSRHQMLTISYYNLAVADRAFAMQVAKKAIEKHYDDMELVAAFLPTYMEHTDDYVWRMTQKENGIYIRKTMPVTYLFDDEVEAKKHFDIMRTIYEGMPKKKLEYSPCIFPWYEVTLLKSGLLVRMSLLAYALQDQELIDWICMRIGQIEGDYYGYRSKHILMLLLQPKTAVQRQALFSYIVDKETMTRNTAVELVREITPTPDECQVLEGYLKYKKEDIRKNIITLLKTQSPNDLIATIDRLLHTKNEEMRLAGLDILKNEKDTLIEKAEKSYQMVVAELATWEQVSDQEMILIQDICGGNSSDNILKEEGYGLYHPKTDMPQLPYQENYQIIKDYFNVSEKTLFSLYEKLYDMVEANGSLEYTDVSGTEHLLCNVGESGLHVISYDHNLPYHERFPFADLWKSFYETYVKDTKTLMNMYYASIQRDCGDILPEAKQLITDWDKKVFGDVATCSLPKDRFNDRYGYGSFTNTVLHCMMSLSDAKLPREVAEQMILYVINQIPYDALWYEYDEEKRGRFYSRETTKYSFLYDQRYRLSLDLLRTWENEEEFQRSFLLLYHLERKVKTYENRPEKNENNYYNYYSNVRSFMDIFYYFKAYDMGIISKDIVYQAIFEIEETSTAIKDMGMLVKDKLYVSEQRQLRGFIQGDRFDKDSSFYQNSIGIYRELIDTILNVELKRGDSPTVFSNLIRKIEKIYGLGRFVSILKALGKSTLDRRTYYYFSSGNGKKECLCHLLQVCYPEAGDTAEKLAEALKGTSIKETRLIEVAMYAPQWIDIIQEYLGYPGFKSGCYYFMAHMNENFDERKMSMIARYTPLTKEELNQGCFDIKWFHEAYEILGEDLFEKIYASAKYISDGIKHSRARKYADAALNKVTVEELEKQISDKRNKDLLMSYGIIPVKDTSDVLHRYEFIQGFLKESKQFGAQRRASEGMAVTYALKNLASAAGYSDETRLILNMETELVKNQAHYLEWYAIEDYELKVQVEVKGIPSLLVQKNGKRLKSVPASLKKLEAYLDIKEFHNKLKEQYRRTVSMLEKSMEERDNYTYGELLMLCENPVTKNIIENLVFVGENVHGIISDGIFLEGAKTEINLDKETELRVAHPYDLYTRACFHEYQEYFFHKANEDGSRQPFKQVFRELYLKLPEEMKKLDSRMFAGYQIQPKKTVACLAKRRWIADYEEGLQKIYYKDNIIARIYALADWFSPADVEAPTLEWVEFSSRKDGSAIAIEDIPDILYSEVMRDVDLAVSVAHAGGVDPETSHSTVEMRKVILEFNLELFGVQNVKIEKNHAIIEGKRGNYSVHLGSGVVHKIGAYLINIVPVQGGKKSKIFLPFIDEDPKTAEIMSKVILFAEDDKIKDPYILKQIG